MPELSSRNTIQLRSGASSTEDYYKNYNITVTRVDVVTGKVSKQTKKIVAYSGGNKIATIDGIWDWDLIPTTSDTYSVTPTYPDSRVSTNFAVMTLDYITSIRYGKGLDPYRDLDLPSWLEAARICDTRSDVTVKCTGAVSGVAAGAIYNYTASGLHWQGTVVAVKHDNEYVQFTDVLGKLTNKWNSWKSYKVGEIIYHNTNVYQVTSGGVKTTAPIHGSGDIDGLTRISSLTLTKVSGTGPSTISLSTIASLNYSVNPVQDKNVFTNREITGYSLYDSDGIDYWRYVGWDGPDQRFVTRHQGNLTVDTSVSLFDNINNLLEHFGGNLSYVAGRYKLNVELESGPIATTTSEVKNITKNDIIGKLRLTDEGMRSSFNSLTVAYADPANKFEAKNISFFNSEFLKADRNVPKKGNLSIPGVTNYYNARLLADNFLIRSRYGLTVSLNVAPRGLLLTAGSVIQLQNDRYGWVDKKFRIENITHNTDCTVDIVAKEHDDSFYAINSISKPPAVGRAGESGILTTLNPSGLTATGISSQNETFGGIYVKWANPLTVDNTVETELYSSFKSQLILTATDILAGNVLRLNFAEELKVGDTLVAKTGTNGLTTNETYYVKEVLVNNVDIKLSTTTDGPVMVLAPATGLNLKFLTGSVIATIPVTMNDYIDVISNSYTITEEDKAAIALLPIEDQEPALVELERIRKYYWIRNKVTKI